MPHPHSGGGARGAVRYLITGAPIVIYACHCTICQTRSGSAFGRAMRIQATDFQLTAGMLKRFARHAGSGQLFTNAVCPDCGTRRHHHANRASARWTIPAG